MKDMLRIVLVPMHREGRKFVIAGLVICVFLWLIWKPLSLAGLGLTVWLYYFFRDPPRLVPQRGGIAVSPADGIVSQIERVSSPPELGLNTTRSLRISVFMNLFNCHVNRAPVGGRVQAAIYQPGKFLNASLDKASLDNERNSLIIESDAGGRIAVVQIAGLVARRIVCIAGEGDKLAVGDRIGLIRFGSRLDVLLPEEAVATVAVGQTAVAGETPIALLDGEQCDYPAQRV